MVSDRFSKKELSKFFDVFPAKKGDCSLFTDILNHYFLIVKENNTDSYSVVSEYEVTLESLNILENSFGPFRCVYQRAL